MSALRQQMTEDMAVRGLAQSTQQAYLKAVERLAIVQSRISHTDWGEPRAARSGEPVCGFDDRSSYLFELLRPLTFLQKWEECRDCARGQRTVTPRKHIK